MTKWRRKYGGGTRPVWRRNSKPTTTAIKATIGYMSETLITTSELSASSSICKCSFENLARCPVVRCPRHVHTVPVVASFYRSGGITQVQNISVCSQEPFKCFNCVLHIIASKSSGQSFSPALKLRTYRGPEAFTVAVDAPFSAPVIAIIQVSPRRSSIPCRNSSRDPSPARPRIRN